ncbi:MAG TPA: hypothetical protein DCZ06_08010 [Alphaproteobacteria bacterium]|nr:hypothetical protein [Alphaproteobacteria bacterium]
MKILFITSNRIGDAILSSGLLAQLADQYRTARFTVAAGPAAAPLFQDMPRLERIIVLEKRPLAGHWRKLWLNCLLHRWDIIVDLRGSAIAWLLWCRRRLVHRSQQSEAHKVVQLGVAYGLDTPPQPRIWCSADRTARAAHLCPVGAPLLALGPTANWVGKQWPIDRFATLAARLTSATGPLAGAQIVVFGGPGEQAMAAPLIKALPEGRVIDLVGKVDLLTAYACLRNATLYIGNDSGLMHLAATAGVPTIGLFGPSRENHYGPWGANTMAVRGTQSFEEIIGAPGYDHLSDQCHMTSLSVERVEAAVSDLLGKVAVATTNLRVRAGQ